MMARTLPQALDEATARKGAGFRFVGDDRSEDEWPFERLALRAREVAVALRERGIEKGDRVALILPASAEFVPTFLGVTYAGAVPVPLYPPMGLGQLGGYLDHARHVVGAAKASLVVTNTQIKAVIGKLLEATDTLRAILTVADLEGDASLHRTPDQRPDDPCFLQFTSGSTSVPKGVVVTHANLAANCKAIMEEGLRTSDADRGLSWLPLFHDMGLIGFVIAPIHYKVPITFLSPMTFLKRPAAWLEYLSKHHGTMTYGPNFAYAITTKRVRDEDLVGIDLSHVRIAGCGAEPIQAETLRAFAKRFAAVGFQSSAFVPSYGMAENTLAIAFARGIPTDVVDAERLWGDGRAEPAPNGGGDRGGETVEIVGCGKAFLDHAIRIVDGESRKPLPERRVGEIQIKGPSVMAGYFENPRLTRETIDRDGWLSTGDLGYLARGEIFICGRQKDILIVNGRNYYPQDIEWAATSIEGIRAGNAIAFSSHRAGLGREAVVVVAETREDGGHEDLATRVKTAIHGATGLMVDEVAIVAAGTLPKTSSGKVQRSKARALWESGALKKRKDEGAVRIAARVVESQLAHLRLRIFGRRSDSR